MNKKPPSACEAAQPGFAGQEEVSVARGSQVGHHLGLVATLFNQALVMTGW